MFILFTALEGLATLNVQDTVPDAFSTPSQLDGDLVTLTLLPRSRWQTLLNLDVIQVSIRIRKAQLTNIVIHSNEINRKNLPKPQKKHLFSCPHCLESNLDSLSNQKMKSSPQSPQEGWTRLLLKPKVYFSINLKAIILRVIVSVFLYAADKS